MNTSPDRNTAAPSRTICGPPPIAVTSPGHAGWRSARTLIVVPAGASARNADAAEPRATRTAPLSGIATDAAPTTIDWTGANTSIPGVDPVNGNTTAAAEPGNAGADGPHADVKRAVPFGPGRWLTSRGCAGRTRPRPRRREGDAADVQGPVRRDARGRAVAGRLAEDGTLLHESAARDSGPEVEEIAVDAGIGRDGRQAALERGECLAAPERVVGEQRLESRGATGARTCDDVEDDRPVRRQLNRLLERDTRPELALLRARHGGRDQPGHDQDQGDGKDGERATHDRSRG